MFLEDVQYDRKVVYVLFHVQNLRYHQFLINLFVYEKAIIFCHVCHGVCTVAGTGDPRDKGSHA